MTDLRKLVEDWCEAEDALERASNGHEQAATVITVAALAHSRDLNDLREEMQAARRAMRVATDRLAETRAALRDAVGRTR